VKDNFNREEARFWKEIKVPGTLREFLQVLTKDDLTDIYRSLDLRGLSALNKQKLLEKFEVLIPEKIEVAFRLLDKERFGLIERIVKNNGFILEKDMPLNRIRHLREQALIFPCLREGKKGLAVAQEVMDLFRNLNEFYYKSIIKRNTEWIKLTQGLLYFYGVLDLNEIRKRLAELTENPVDFLEYMEVIFKARSYYGEIQIIDSGYTHKLVIDGEDLIDEQEARSEIPYYHFTKAQLLQAGEPDFIERTRELNSVIEFLSGYYDLSEEEKDEIAIQCVYIIKLDGSLPELLEYLQSILEFPSQEMLQQLAAKLVALCNNTRLWVLKGHTPEEISQQKRKHLQNMSPLSTAKKKIGRNELCPCGSGKKYKRCCGK